MSRCRCTHLVTAHLLPDGHCQLCTCTRFAHDDEETLMADIGEPQREVTFEPLEQPEPGVVPAPVAPQPERQPVPA